MALNTRKAINDFLASVEKRSYHMTYLATSKHEDALDILQDAMYTLVKNYADSSAEEWPALFHRILQNKIRDWYRKQRLLNRFFFWQSDNRNDDSLDESNSKDPKSEEPANVLSNEQLASAINSALSRLPLQQQQTFLLRAWEGMSVKQTADIMQISEGSVKTHYSRSLQALRKALHGFV